MTSSFYSHLGCENKYICVVQIDPERWKAKQRLPEKLSLSASLLTARPGCFTCLAVFPPTLQLGQIWLCLAGVRAPGAVVLLAGKGERSRAWVHRDGAPLGLAGRWLPLPAPPGPPSKSVSGILTDFGSWLPMQEGFHGNVPVLRAPSSLPPRHFASLLLLAPLPSPPVSEACCHGKL